MKYGNPYGIIFIYYSHVELFSIHQLLNTLVLNEGMNESLMVSKFIPSLEM